MNEWLAMISMVLGSLLMGIAALGILRFPDLFMRMHATSKAGALGIAFQLQAVGFYFGDMTMTIKVAVGILFFLLTIPVASHMIGRAGYWQGVRLWENSVLDDLKGKYDRENKTLSGAEESFASVSNDPNLS